MDAHERRMLIWRSLCYRRFDTAAHLAKEYNVSVRTVYYDVQILSLAHPIETVRGRYGGGIKIPDWYKPNLNAFTPEQLNLLLKLKANLTGNDFVIMTSIIERFSG